MATWPLCGPRPLHRGCGALLQLRRVRCYPSKYYRNQCHTEVTATKKWCLNRGRLTHSCIAFPKRGRTENREISQLIQALMG